MSPPHHDILKNNLEAVAVSVQNVSNQNSDSNVIIHQLRITFDRFDRKTM